MVTQTDAAWRSCQEVNRMKEAMTLDHNYWSSSTVPKPGRLNQTRTSLGNSTKPKFHLSLPTILPRPTAKEKKNGGCEEKKEEDNEEDHMADKGYILPSSV